MSDQQKEDMSLVDQDHDQEQNVAKVNEDKGKDMAGNAEINLKIEGEATQIVETEDAIKREDVKVVLPPAKLIADNKNEGTEQSVQEKKEESDDDAYYHGNGGIAKEEEPNLVRSPTIKGKVHRKRSSSARHSLFPRMRCMQKFILYETASFYYLVGCNVRESKCRVLKLDRRIDKPQSLEEILQEDPIIYSKTELKRMLDMIHEGNKTSGGLQQVVVACGIVGFVKFLDCYYITLITQKKRVGCIGQNYIYAIKAVEVIPIKPKDNPTGKFSFTNIWNTVNKKFSQTNTDESRYLGLFQFLDISKDFYFSYTYDLTHCVQYNYLIAAENGDVFPPPPYKEMYEWNHYQLEEFRNCIGEDLSLYWCMPIIHGSYEQREFSIFGKPVDLILIARRSRYYAGTRYLKRGVSVHGKVANDCEMEQILQVDRGANVKLASFVQMRGSIPTYWYQETSVTMPKPPILVDRVDPNYLATQEHFADLIKRYNGPIVVLDLVKQNEKRKRESIVGKEFREAVETINETLPFERKIRYCALDFSRMSKSKKKPLKTKESATGKEWTSFQSSLGDSQRSMKIEVTSSPVIAKGDVGMVSFDRINSWGSSDQLQQQLAIEKSQSYDHPASLSQPPQSPLPPREGNSTTGRLDVLRELEDIANWTLFETGLFCSTASFADKVSYRFQDNAVDTSKQRGYFEQQGVLRTNCIDCLDRTNVAQFAMGVRVLATALQALGLSNTDSVEPSNPIMLGLIDMFSEMGDKLALQYGGSEAHKKVSGKASGKTKQGELLTSIKRYYSNAFTDRLKQDAMNVFLGLYQPFMSNYALWDIETDYFLHNRLLSPPRPEYETIMLNYEREVLDKESEEEERNISDLTALQSTFVANYLTDLSYENEDVVAHVQERELTKIRLSRQNRKIVDALELWWREAEDQHLKQRICIHSSTSPEDAEYTDYYDVNYRPDELTSFENDLLVNDFQQPIDATELGVAKARAGNTGWTPGHFLKRDDSELRPTPEDEEELAEFLGEKPVTKTAAVDQEGFSLGKYMKDLGSMAASFVGGISQALTYESPIRSSRSPLGQPVKGSPDESQRSQHAVSAILKHVPYNEYANRLYVKYQSDYNTPENFLNETNESVKNDYAKLMKEYTVDADDVKGMEELALNGFISSTVDSGPYRGMWQYDSAVQTHALVHNCLVNVESAVAQAPRNVINIPPAIKQSMDSLLAVSTKKPSVGIEEAVNKSIMRYIHEQHVIAREVDADRLSKRLSHLTTENVILDYISNFEKEMVASNVGEIRFTASDKISTTAMPFLDISLTTLQKQYPLISHQERSQLEAQSNLLANEQMVCKEKSGQHEFEIVDCAEYGFHQIGNDVFMKDSNNHLICNTISMNSYAKYCDKTKGKLALTATAVSK